MPFHDVIHRQFPWIRAIDVRGDEHPAGGSPVVENFGNPVTKLVRQVVKKACAVYQIILRFCGLLDPSPSFFEDLVDRFLDEVYPRVSAILSFYLFYHSLRMRQGLFIEIQKEELSVVSDMFLPDKLLNLPRWTAAQAQNSGFLSLFHGSEGHVRDLLAEIRNAITVGLSRGLFQKPQIQDLGEKRTAFQRVTH